MMILPSGSFDVPPDLPFVAVARIGAGERHRLRPALEQMSVMSLIGTSLWCGPSVEPQQTCMRMRSAGKSLTA